ncbi:MAG TPA: sigma-70 family RNA polymerase sigma factor [Pirellulales bacterium]|jgi:RNA polymerase sigma-70 factor (ECF subfamily)|nr:sigma-70 family RNA polymerase sigma factor [Pirellulales bacterium]
MQSSNNSGTDSLVAALLDRARGGDAQAEERLLTMCRNYLSVIARRQIGSWLRPKVDASDLVQQTLLEAHRGMAHFEGRSREEWLAWLRQILARNAVDFVRHYQQAEKRCVGREVSLTVQGPAASDAVGFEPPDPADSPSQLVMQWERELQVADALTQLAADYQQVVLLRNVEQLPFDEVARRMNRSRPAVQMLWMRAIHQLQTLCDTL